MKKYLALFFVFLPGFVLASTVDDYQYQLNQFSEKVVSFGERLQFYSEIISSGQARLPDGQVAGVSIEKCAFARSLYLGRSGEDVRCLQQYLNSSGFVVSQTGPGSLGNETIYYGQLTRTAVTRFQVAYNISPSAGYFGSISQAKYQEILSAVSVQPSQTPVAAPEIVSPATVTPISRGETVELPSQIDGVVGISVGLPISNSLIPAGAIIPFVNFMLDPGRPLEIIEFVIEHSGTGLLSDFQEVIVTTDEAGQPRGSGQVVAIGSLDTVTHLASSPTFSSWTFNTPLSLTVSGVMKKEIAHDVTHSLKIQSVKFREPATGSRYEISGGGITSATHRTDQAKQVGTVELGGISVDGKFGNLVIKAGSYEDVTIRSITLLETGESVKIGGASYPCRLAHGREFCSFGADLALLKEQITTLKPFSLNAQIKKTYDLSVTGDTSGFRIIPSAPVVLGAVSGLYSQMQSDLARMKDELLKMRTQLALLVVASF